MNASTGRFSLICVLMAVAGPALLACSGAQPVEHSKSESPARPAMAESSPCGSAAELGRTYRRIILERDVRRLSALFRERLLQCSPDAFVDVAVPIRAVADQRTLLRALLFDGEALRGRRFEHAGLFSPVSDRELLADPRSEVTVREAPATANAPRRATVVMTAPGLRSTEVEFSCIDQAWSISDWPYTCYMDELPVGEAIPAGR